MDEWNELPVVVRRSPRRLYEYIKEAIEGVAADKDAANTPTQGNENVDTPTQNNDSEENTLQE